MTRFSSRVFRHCLPEFDPIRLIQRPNQTLRVLRLCVPTAGYAETLGGGGGRRSWVNREYKTGTACYNVSVEHATQSIPAYYSTLYTDGTFGVGNFTFLCPKHFSNHSKTIAIHKSLGDNVCVCVLCVCVCVCVLCVCVCVVCVCVLCCVVCVCVCVFWGRPNGSFLGSTDKFLQTTVSALRENCKFWPCLCTSW